jgi:hypothetical protein
MWLPVFFRLVVLKTIHNCVSFQVFAVVTVQIMVAFRDFTLCSVFCLFWRFGGTNCSRFQSDIWFRWMLNWLGWKKGYRLCAEIWGNYENNQQDALYGLIYYSNSALHVKDDVFAHHQKHLTVFTVSDRVYPSCCRLVSLMSWNLTTVHSSVSTH